MIMKTKGCDITHFYIIYIHLLLVFI